MPPWFYVLISSLHFLFKIKTTSYSEYGRSDLCASATDSESVNKTGSSTSGHTSGKDSTKRTKQKGRKYNGRLSSIKTQHFIELLSSMRYESPYTCLDKPLKRIYGMYIVMNKVYVTCLMAKFERPDDFADTDNEYIFDEDNIKAIRYVEMMSFLKETNCENYNFPDGKWAKAGYKFEVLYSKCLDIFRPGHLKALLMFVNFVVYSDHKKTMFSKKILE